MRWCVLLVALLQSLCCSGFPLHQSDVSSMADKALGIALDDVNTRLFRVTRASVTKVVPMGMNTYDLMMSFGIKETDCLRSSGEDPQGCPFRAGFFVPSSSCSARVRMSAEAAQVVSLRCGQEDSSSSESSSEEMFMRRRQFNVPTFGNRGPVPTAPRLFGVASPLFPGNAVPRQEVNTQLRGDTYSNTLT